MDKITSIGAIGLAMLALSLLVASPAAQTVTSVNNLLSITNLTVSPNPVVAGSNVTVMFMLFNSYSDSLKNVNLQLQADNQLLNVSPSHSYIISSVGSGQYGGLGYNVFKYRFHVPSTLSSGLYTIDVVANYEAPISASYNMPGVSTMPITFYVYGIPQLSFNVIPQGSLVPGSTFGFTLSTVNTGTDTASNVSIRVLSSNGFSMSGQTSFSLGSIAPGSYSTSSLSAIVAPDISSGEHNLTIEVGYSTAARSYSYVGHVPITIAPGTPSIAFSIESTSPQLLYSGSNQSVTILVQNIGTGTAKNLSVAMGGSRAISVQSSASRFFIGSLAPGASSTATVVVSANSSLGPGNDYIVANVSYYNANYEVLSSFARNISINVAPSAVFQIESVNDSLAPGGAYMPITLTLKNVGNQAAKDVSLSLQSIYPITPVAGNAYISYLAPGSETNVTFYVNVDQNGLQGQYLLTLYEQWRQTNAGVNQAFTSSNNYYAVVYSSKQDGTDITPYVIAAIAIVIILVAARVLLKRRKGKQKAKR